MTNLSTLRVPDGHMTDDDKGLFNEQFNNDLALLQHQQQHAIDPNAVSAWLCEHCNNDIPMARREALPGVQTCVYCQEAIERQARGMR